MWHIAKHNMDRVVYYYAGFDSGIGYFQLDKYLDSYFNNPNVNCPIE